MSALLTNVSAQGAGASQTWGGGRMSFEASATAWNGATVAVQAKNADGTWSDLAGSGLTASGRVSVIVGPGSIRANVTGGTPTAMNAAAWRLRGA